MHPALAQNWCRGVWGVYRRTVAITIAKKQSLRWAPSLKGWDLRSELVMGVSLVSHWCVVGIIYKPIRVSRPHPFNRLMHLSEHYYDGGASLR